MACQNGGEIVLSRAFGVGTDAGVLLQQMGHGCDDVFLHGRVAKIEYELVAFLFGCACWQAQGPVGVGSVEVAVGADHFRFDPETETDAETGGFAGEWCEALGKFVRSRCPVAQ